MEEWRDIKGFEGLYQVSNLGRIKSLEHFEPYKGRPDKQRLMRSRIKSQTNAKGGYLKVTLWKNRHQETRQVQRYVAEAFIPNPEKKVQVNHIDGNKKNNNVANLEWVTPSENMWHSANVLKNSIKAVDQYDLHGNYISTYESAVKAAEANNMKPCGISNVIYGRRNKAGGYIWKMSSGILTPRKALRKEIS